MQRTRLLLIGIGVAAVVVLFLVLRPGGDDDETAAPATTAAETTATGSSEAETVTEADTTDETTPEATPTAPPPPAAPTVATIQITIRGGTPVGGLRRASVRQGRQVRFVVRSDVADEVHVHGYDLMRDVAPGQPAQISFRATIPGRFEVELEDRGLAIAQLEVRP
jgi:heme/copper-type cytochrome/quinol oxidase subunit 2